MFKSRHSEDVFIKSIRFMFYKKKFSTSKSRDLKEQIIISNLLNHLSFYPTPINLNYSWSFGSLSGICLVIQIITGILLAMHYTPHIDYAFQSIEHIMRDVNNGWLIRYFHSNGASMMFIVVYCHIFKGLYYASYIWPRQYLWLSGVIILLLMMATAFMGYVLPWGQMSFWGATVITNLFSAIPFIGNFIVEWLWGGFSVSNPTLNRFFSLHFFLPFIIAAMAGIHLILLHKDGSSNPLNNDSKDINKIDFNPYFIIKDLFSLLVFMIFFSLFVFFAPNFLGHPDNYIPANPMVTPEHIVPEWYFLPFYAILRSIPDKLGGVIAMFLSIFALAITPFMVINNKNTTRVSTFRPIFKIGTFLLVSICIILGWIGQKEVISPYIEIGQISTVFYFSYFFLFLPLLKYMEFIKN